MYRTGQLRRKPYSQMWRYKEEAARFEKLQSQYLYLCRYNIRSADDLKGRRDILDTRIKNLDEERHQIYKWRYPHKPALALLKIIEENEARASYYKEGSTFYAPYYEKWKEAVEVLAEKDYSIGRLMEIKEKVQEQLALVAKSKKELKREENLIDSILYGEGKAQMIECRSRKYQKYRIYRSRIQRKQIFRKKKLSWTIHGKGVMQKKGG